MRKETRVCGNDKRTDQVRSRVDKHFAPQDREEQVRYPASTSTLQLEHATSPCPPFFHRKHGHEAAYHRDSEEQPRIST